MVSLIGMLLVLPRTAFEAAPELIFADGFDNHDPVITSLPLTTAQAGVPYSYDADATDIDGDTLQYLLTTAPAGMTIDAASGLIEWTPGSTGSFPVSLTVSDGHGGSAEQGWTIVVGESGVASIVISTHWVYFSAVGQTRQLSAQLFDADLSPVAGTVIWYSTAPDQVSVSASGQIAALAIGSAQIYAEAGGVRSPATLVMVATPAPGALLVSDAQVVAVGDPLPDVPDAERRYEVTLWNVVAPALGTIVLASELAQVAGRVVDTRADPAGLVVTLEIVSLQELYQAYDINWSIDLADYPLEPIVPPEAGSPLPATATSRSESAVRATRNKDPAPAVSIGPMPQFDCDGSIGPQLISSTVSLSPQIDLKLNIQDSPNYSRHTVEGTASLTGSANIKLAAGFKATGKCEAISRFKLPIFGAISVLVMPTVRFGLGAELSGEVLVVQGELGVSGKIGTQTVSGWECGGAEPGCQGLNNATRVNEFKPTASFPSLNGMQAKLSGHFYILTGLDVSLLVLADTNVLSARFGPKQSLDLAFESDQALREDYAAFYDLKLEGGVVLNPNLVKYLKKLYGVGGGSINFGAGVSVPISESPKGTLTASASRIPLGNAVDLNVQLDGNTINYFLLGYNVDSIEIYRRRADETEFTPLHSILPSASAQTIYQYHWTPTAADVGKNYIAAFVNTQLPTPYLEIAPNTVKEVEVSCFSAGGAQSAGMRNRLQVQAGSTRLTGSVQATTAAAATCADAWTGSGSYLDPGRIQVDVDVTWQRDTSIPETLGDVHYVGQGTAVVDFLDYESAGCTVSPKTFDLDPDFNKLVVVYAFDPPQYSGDGGFFGTTTVSCPGSDPYDAGVSAFWFAGEGEVSADGLTIQGSDSADAATWWWNFTRP